jgi:hypothetical protein
MLKFSKKIQKLFWKENKEPDEILGNILFVEMESSKLINYSITVVVAGAAAIAVKAPSDSCHPVKKGMEYLNLPKGGL